MGERRLRGLGKAGLTLILVTGLAHLASADIVRLKNGNKFEGKIIDRNAKRVVIKIPDMGQMTFIPSEIASIEESPAVQVLTQTDKDGYLDEGVSSREAPARDLETDEDRRKHLQRESHLVTAMGVNMRNEDGVYAADISFRDKDHKLCATKGRLVISREVTEYKTDFKVACTTCFAEEVKTPVMKEQTVRSVNFGFDDFQGYENDSIYLPVRFRSGEIDAGDAISFQWRSYTVKKYAPKVEED